MAIKIRDKKKVFFLVGPTAAGKTEAAAALALKVNAEIVSCDSMQVYKGMDIGTQKPTPQQRKIVPHHMVDILTPDEEFSAADFRKRALGLIGKIHKKGKVPLFVGGTGLYVKALIDGLFPSPPKDEKLRKKLYENKDLYALLQKIDPEAAGRIHPNDKKKIVRALEIYYTTGKPMSRLLASTRPLSGAFDVIMLGINMDREELYSRIDERTDRMFEEGFLEEAARIARVKTGLTASQAIGYRELFDHLSGRITLDEARALIKKNTRRYAKRQLTWFRADKRILWLKIKKGQGPEATAKRLAALIKRKENEK